MVMWLIAKFGGQRHPGSGDTIFLVVEKISDALTSICHYCLPVKYMAWKHAI